MAPPASPAVTRSVLTSGPPSAALAARTGAGVVAGRGSDSICVSTRLPSWAGAPGRLTGSSFRAKCRPVALSVPALPGEGDAVGSAPAPWSPALECLPIALMAFSMGSRARSSVSTCGSAPSLGVSTGATRSPGCLAALPAFALSTAPRSAASCTLSCPGSLSGMISRRCLSKAVRYPLRICLMRGAAVFTISLTYLLSEEALALTSSEGGTGLAHPGPWARKCASMTKRAFSSRSSHATGTRSASGTASASLSMSATLTSRYSPALASLHDAAAISTERSSTRAAPLSLVGGSPTSSAGGNSSSTKNSPPPEPRGLDLTP